MDSTIHTHIAALYIQDRIAVAAGERQAREVVRSRTPRRRSLRSPWGRPVVSVPRTLRT
jgi:hypothetical protein